MSVCHHYHLAANCVCTFLVALFLLCAIDEATAKPILHESEPSSNTLDGKRQLRPQRKLLPAAKTIEFSEQDAERYLRSYGYLPKKRYFMRSEKAYAFRKFQRRRGLLETGTLDEATRIQMQRPRCGVEDFQSDDAPSSGFPIVDMMRALMPQSRRQRRSTQETAPKKIEANPVLFRVGKFSHYVDNKFTLEQVRDAIRVWQKHIPTEFKEVDDAEKGQVDIDIGFELRDHADGQPFDGPGQILAHAFYPMTKYAGNLHFDDEEVWASPTNDNAGRNLLWVAAHEIGHALGLTHSQHKDSLMYDNYDGFRHKQVDLMDEDVQRIQTLYGERADDKPLPRRNTVAPGAANVLGVNTASTTPPPLPICADGRIDTIFQLPKNNASIYAFRGEHYYKLMAHPERKGNYTVERWGLIKDGFSFLQDNGLPAVTGDIDEVISIGDMDATYVIKGESAWEIQSENSNLPVTISTAQPYKSTFDLEPIGTPLSAFLQVRDDANEGWRNYAFRQNSYSASDTIYNRNWSLNEWPISSIASDLTSVDGGVYILGRKQAFIFADQHYYELRPKILKPVLETTTSGKRLLETPAPVEVDMGVTMEISIEPMLETVGSSRSIAKDWFDCP